MEEKLTLVSLVVVFDAAERTANAEYNPSDARVAMNKLPNSEMPAVFSEKLVIDFGDVFHVQSDWPSTH